MRLRVEIDGVADAVDMELPIDSDQVIRVKIRKCLRYECPIYFADLPGIGKQYCTNSGPGNCKDMQSNQKKKNAYPE